MLCSLGYGRNLPTLSDKHVSSGFASQLLTEVIAHESSTERHLYCILFDLRFDIWRYADRYRVFNAHKVCPSQLLKKKVMDVKIYRELISYGMQVNIEDIAYAVKNVGTVRLKLVDLLVEKCKYEYSDRTAYDKIIEAIEVKKSEESVGNKKQHKGVLKQLITILRKGTKVINV